MKKYLPILAFCSILYSYQIHAQQMISGTVKDEETQQPLVGVNIYLAETGKGTTSNKDGQFQLNTTASLPLELKISYIGYENKSVTVTAGSQKLEIQLQRSSLTTEEVVVSASRFDEKIQTSPISIKKIDAAEVSSAASGDFLQSLGNYQEVQVINSSLGLRVFNSRGFNTTSPFRIVQFIDGMDNQSAGLNFSAGNMFGIPDIDIEEIEMITGPASALYGPNALQGVVSIYSKNPYEHQGVQASVKGGSRDFIEGQLRFAETFGKDKKWGLELTSSYMSATDWPANDSAANGYLPVPSPPQNLNSLISDLAADPDNPNQQLYSSFLSYMDTSSANVSPNTSPAGRQFILPAYLETDLFDQKIGNVKLTGNLQYKFSENLTGSYQYRYTRGTGVYQGNNRAYLQNMVVQQHGLSLIGKRFLLKAYTTMEDAHDSYDLVLTGINIGMASLPRVNQAFVDAYVNNLSQSTNGFTQATNSTEVGNAQTAGAVAADNAWLEPGTEAFNQVLKGVSTNPARPTGSQYTSKSALQHVEGQYNFELPGEISTLIGGNFRRYIPRSDGNIFSDTLASDGDRVNISYFEFGGFAQFSRTFLNEKLKLLGSFRLDKSENYDFQYSPRLAAVFTQKNHSLRIAAQSAFRSPTLNDQYFLLNVGPLIVRGNISGYDNLYSQSSVNAYQASLMQGNPDPSLLQAIQLDPVKPEQLNTIEFGYNGLFAKRFKADFNAYYNQYNNFIGNIRAVEPLSGVAGETSGLTDINTRNYQAYSIASNSSTSISTFGTSLGIRYYLGKGITSYANYTLTQVDTAGVTDDLIPGFNTPPHQANIGLQGQRVWKGLGFSANFKWNDHYFWESPFADGPVPSFHTLDLQLNYKLDKLYSTFRVGGSNIYGNPYYQAYGAPEIGAFYYVGWDFNLNNVL